ncbi:hypothetical protein AURDEDRAFT_164126 [Auricularia subglabra TFB-10046 SS5]|nr:hypothetical protein AURDEDRAFT_164126 [Auricularia subglabra TFB-10046 SS5]
MPQYDGTADYDQFEAFVSKWDSWQRSKALSDREAVEYLRHALTGKASTWYTNFVAMQLKGWTMKKVYKEMYESCFPVNFREDLRDKMMAATQRGRPIKDYAKDLENMSIRYDDIDKGTVKRILWDGVEDYIRLYWIEKGLSLEFSDVPTLIYYAYRVERREHERKRMEPVSPKTEDPGRTAGTPKKAKVKRQLKALPVAAVRIMSIAAATPLLNYVHAAICLAEAETHMLELFRDEIRAAALEFYHPISCAPARGNLNAPEDRFLVAVPNDRGTPPIAPGTVVLYDVLHDVELEFPVSEFRDDDFNFARTFFFHYGIAVDERECELRVDVPELPWPIPVRGVLTLIDGEWAAASSHHALLQLGLERDQRWVLQTDGRSYWARDFAFGLCYEVTREMLSAGTNIERIVREPEYFDRRGEVNIPLDKRFHLSGGQDWQFPYVASEQVETRHVMWRQAAKLARDSAQAKRVVSDLWADYDGIPAVRRFHRLDTIGRGTSDNNLGLYRIYGNESDSSLSEESDEDSPDSMPELESEPGSDAEASSSEDERVAEYRPLRTRAYNSSTSDSSRMWSSEDGDAVDSSDMEVDSDDEQQPLLAAEQSRVRAAAWVVESERARAYRAHRGDTERRRARVVRADADPVLVGHYEPGGVQPGSSSESGGDIEEDIGTARACAFFGDGDDDGFVNVDL